jgi:cytochrome c5
MAVAESTPTALLLIALLTCGFTTSAWVRHAAAKQDRPATASSASSVRAALDRYCVTCHNARIKTANLMLDRMDVAQPKETVC